MRFADLARHARRHDLDLGRYRAGGLELLDVFIDLHRFGGGLADRLEPAGPGRPRRDEPDMADDRDALGRELGDRVEAAGAIERVPADHQVLVRGAQIILIGAVLAVDEPDLNETVARRLAHRGRPEVFDDRQDINAGRGRRSRFFRRFDEQHRQLPLALELAQVADRQPIVFRQSHAIPSTMSHSIGQERREAETPRPRGVTRRPPASGARRGRRREFATSSPSTR